MKVLCDGQVGKIYKIIEFQKSGDRVLRRFMELGFCCGTTVKIVATSLLKKVFLLEIRGYVLSARVSLLKGIVVEEC